MENSKRFHGKINQESLSITVGNDHFLHVKRFWQSLDGTPVLMVHGSISHGRTFYSDSGKGIAPFLADCGFDVYVLDLRGHGLSQPSISATSEFGQHEAILEDIPACIDLIRSIRGDVPQYWLGHSWGGVLLLSVFARCERFRNQVRGMIFFGSKRRIQVQNIEKWIKIDLFWNLCGPLLVRKCGYLPTKILRIGSDNETKKFYRETSHWIRSPQWVDLKDGFDYGKSLRKAALPRCLYFAGSQDLSLGNPRDVQDLIEETGAKRVEFRLLQGYGHIDMLTSPRAVQEHFTDLLHWMKRDSGVP